MNLFVFILCLTLFVIRSGITSSDERGIFTKFMDMVLSNISATESYILPTDNSELLNITNTIENYYGTFDFIVIGAGAAGAVVANRLSENLKWKILLLEAGGQDNDFTKILGLSTYTYFSDFNWGYNTTTQKHACQGLKNKRAIFPTGKVIGGGTTINAGLYSRGHPEDFNRWVEVYGNQGWSYEEVLQYFKKSENAVFTPRDVDYHGVGGYFTVDYTSDTPGLEPPIIEGFQELGLNYVDYNGRVQNGIAKVQNALKRNERVSSASAFLKEPRRNLEISLNSFVTEIIISADKVAQGVKFVRNGQIFTANARKEVVVSAGVINSAQLLMLSGIGPREHLSQIGIPVKQDLPVGQKLQDHCYFLAFYYRTNHTFYNQNITEQLKLWIKNKRPLTSGFASEMIGFTNFGQSQEKRPEIEFIFSTPGISSDQAQKFLGLTEENAAVFHTNTSTDIWVIPSLLHPKSRGTVTLKSKDPKDRPIIDPNYLSEKHDIDTLYKGIEFLVELSKTRAFKKFGVEILIMDYPECRNLEKLSENWWKCALTQLTTTFLHPASTNNMGPDPKNSVVNARLKVHGIKKLRVADSSILPELTSGHLMAPTMMIGEKAADMIKEDHGNLSV